MRPSEARVAWCSCGRLPPADVVVNDCFIGLSLTRPSLSASFCGWCQIKPAAAALAKLQNFACPELARRGFDGILKDDCILARSGNLPSGRINTTLRPSRPLALLATHRSRPRPAPRKSPPDKGQHLARSSGSKQPDAPDDDADAD